MISDELRARLDRMFDPCSVAVIGAGADPETVGHAIVDSIVYGGFAGRIYPVHPRHTEIMGLKVYRDIADLPEVPDLAVVASQPTCHRGDHRYAIAYGSSWGKPRRRRVCGNGRPGCRASGETSRSRGRYARCRAEHVGVPQRPQQAQCDLLPAVSESGEVSVLSQSGGIGLAMVGRAADEGMGLAKWVGVGNRLNLEFHTLIEYLGSDPETKVIGIFMEGTAHPRAFLSACAAITPHKPVVVYKGGKGTDADRNTVSHTGAAAGNDALGRARSGRRVWRPWRPPRGDGGRLQSPGRRKSPGREARGHINAYCRTVYRCMGRALPGAWLLPCPAGPGHTRQDRLDSGSPRTVVIKNPVDGAGGAFLQRPFHDIAEAMMDDPSVDALLAIFCEHKNWPYPTDALIDLAGRTSRPIVACFIGSVSRIGPDRARLHEARVPTYVLPEEAALGIRALLRRVGR